LQPENHFFKGKIFSGLFPFQHKDQAAYPDRDDGDGKNLHNGFCFVIVHGDERA
jgi:hypothetical protein